MSFQETYEAYLSELEKAPSAPPMTQQTQKGSKLKYVRDGKRATHKIRDITYPVPPSAKAYQKHAEDISAFRAKLKAHFLGLSPNDRRKLSALFNAGATNTSVRAQYAALPDGSMLGALANAAALRAGMALALQAEIAIEAARW
jgi:hypothetical protein